MKFLSIFFLSLSLFVPGSAETRGFLTPEDIALFYKQGYLLKQKVFDENETNRLRDNVSWLLDKAMEEVLGGDYQVLPGEEHFIEVDGSVVVFKLNPTGNNAIARIQGCAGIRPELLDTVRSDKMVHTFSELLGTSDLEHLITQMHPKFPGDGVSFPRHQDVKYRKLDPDWEDILGNGSYAICMIPIDSMSFENGGLWVDENSYPEFQNAVEKRVWIRAEPGDILFIHPHVYHGSGPNLSKDSSRRLLLTGFCAFGANHRRYPGAHVNGRLKLDEEGNIVIEPVRWEKALPNAMIGH